MIIIKTANGDSFINESEIQVVNHNKEYCHVTITFKDGHCEIITQVESIRYTNKQETDIVDNGLMMESAVSDAEFFKQMNESAMEFLKRIYRDRRELESLIIDMFENPDKNTSYREDYINELRKKRQERPITIEEELRKFRDTPYYMKLRSERLEKGDEVAKEFARLTSELNEAIEWKERYYKGAERLMARNLWQRIVNARVTL